MMQKAPKKTEATVMDVDVIEEWEAYVEDKDDVQMSTVITERQYGRRR